MDNIVKNEALLSDCDITVSLIEKKLNILIDEIHKRNKSNFIDINQIVELCIINIFNIIFGWKLHICVNCREKCIDASDDENKIWIQITSNNEDISKKVILRINNDNNNQNPEAILEFKDFELNSMDYEEAIKSDKRSYVQYYISLLKNNHLFILYSSETKEIPFEKNYSRRFIF